MNIVLLQTRLDLEEIDLLLKEFPQFLFLSLSETSYKNLSPEQWSRVEIIYGNRLTPEDLAQAHQLHWIHTSQMNVSRISFEEIEKRSNILVTNTPDENFYQVGEFVMGGILAFVKNLFHWRDVDRYPAAVWDSKWRDSMMTLKDSQLLQIGLGSVGTEITRRARLHDMQVWGVQEKRSFHPYCHKTFGMKDLHSILPEADVVCISHQRGKSKVDLFREAELELMKNDSILVIIGSSNLVNEDALAIFAPKFRGVLLDAFYETALSPQSKLWGLQNIIITPDVSPRPKSTERQSFRLFLYNLRQYLHGNFKDMRNLVSKM